MFFVIVMTGGLAISSSVGIALWLMSGIVSLSG